MKKDAVSDIEIMKTRYQFIISTGFALIEGINSNILHFTSNATFAIVGQ